MYDAREGRARHPSYNPDPQGRVIVGVSDSLASLGALRRAVAEARRRQLPLCAVRVVPVLHTWVGIIPLLDDHLAAIHQQITTAFADTLGGIPPDVETRTVVMVGTPGAALVRFARHHDDLLVVGGGRRRWWRRSVNGYCVRHARCAVLTVPLPEFARRMQRLRLPRRRVDLDALLDA